MSQLADDIRLNTENPNDVTIKLPELISELKLQDTELIYRNMLHFYMLATKYQKEKLRKKYHLPLHLK